MIEENHLQALDELRRARGRLVLPDDIRAYTELSFGIALHLLAIGAQRRYGVHRDNHEGLGRWLRERGDIDVAEALAQVEQLRMGRWYGRQGNGHTAEQLDQLLAALEAWAMAQGGR